MNIKRLAGIVFLIFVLIVGCSGPNRNIRKQTDNEDKVTLAKLIEDFDDYDIYYTTRSGRWASAIMFDPKDDGKTLVGDWWVKIDDQEGLSESIRQIRMWYDNYARVLVIEGPENQTFGYIYISPWYIRVVQVKEVDERTLYVGNMPGYGSAP